MRATDIVVVVRRPSGAFGRYQEIVCHGVLLEEDEWAREEEERTLRGEEDKEDVKSRERRGGTAMGEAHAWGCQEERARCKTRGNLERGGHAGATIMPAFETSPRILSSAKTFP